MINIYYNMRPSQVECVLNTATLLYKNLCKTIAHYRIRSVTWRYRQVKQF